MKTSRRNFNSFLFSASLFSLYPNLLKSSSYGGKYLILIELQGANDGLNTVIPYSNPFYYKLRPNIAIKQEDIQILTPQREGEVGIYNLNRLIQQRTTAGGNPVFTNKIKSKILLWAMNLLTVLQNP